jgi:hypothetical protein
LPGCIVYSFVLSTCQINPGDPASDNPAAIDAEGEEINVNLADPAAVSQSSTTLHVTICFERVDKKLHNRGL